MNSSSSVMNCCKSAFNSPASSMNSDSQVMNAHHKSKKHHGAKSQKPVSAGQYISLMQQTMNPASVMHAKKKKKH